MRSLTTDDAHQAGETYHAGVDRTPSEGILNLIDELRAALDDLELGILDRDPDSPTHDLRGNFTVATLTELASRRGRIGYPTASMSGGRRGSVKDDENVPMPPLSDPVGEAVVADNDNTFRRPAADIRRYLTGARGDLAAAVSALSSATPKQRSEAELEPRCRSCARLDVFEHVYRAGSELCRWCYDFNVLHRTEPPLELLDLHHRGARITSRMITDALAAPARRRRRGKARARR
jgi:hypothetical protein